MQHNKRFSIASRIKSFRFAFFGIQTLFRSEYNAWIHLLAAILALIFGFLLHISQEEWLFVILAISLVFAAEMINTALEVLSDYVQPEQHEAIKKVKDLAAAAVLVIALAALAGGLLIFLPKLIAL